MPVQRKNQVGDPLTARQQQCLDIIVRGWLTGRPPTVREMGAAMGIQTPNGIAVHLKPLLAKGAIVATGDKGDSRRYRPARLPCPHCGKDLYEAKPQPKPKAGGIKGKRKRVRG